MIDEISFCTCGLEMKPIRNGSQFKYCPNCDRCQDTERGDNSFRAPTVRDGVFNRRWKEKMKEIYA